MKQILTAVERTAAEHGGGAVTRIDLSVGALRQVAPALLQFAFEAAREGTCAAQAELVWHEVPARVRCGACGRVFHPPDVLWTCPACDTPGGEVLEGEELLITCIELEEPACAARGA